MRPKRPPLHPQWAEWQPYGGKPSVKVSRILSLVPLLIRPMRPKRPPLHPQWAEWQPYGGKPSVKVSRILLVPTTHSPDALPKRPPLHPQWAEWQPYGGKPSVKVSRIFISPHYSFAQCAPNGHHCTHSGPNGSHMGGNLVSKSREFLLVPTTHSPNAPQTATTAPTVGRMAAIWGET